MLFSLFQASPILILYFTVSILISLTFHEFAHAWAATRYGDPTPKSMGRLTLNPIKHLDLFGTIIFFIVGIGWAKPVLYNPNNLRGKWDEVKIALAGPITNIILAFIFAIPYRIGYLMNIDPSTFTASPIHIFFNFLVEINIWIAVFNLLPIPPLDGSKILFPFVSYDIRRKIELYGVPILLLIFFLGFMGYIDLLSILKYPVWWLEYLVRVFPFGLI